MKTQTLLVAFTSALLALTDVVSAKCYTSGDNWPNRDEARKFIIHACSAPGGMFTGSYAKGQTKAMCPRSGNVGLLFEVQNNTSEGSELNDDDCIIRLENEITKCDKGGESTISGWRFRAHPGNC